MALIQTKEADRRFARIGFTEKTNIADTFIFYSNPETGESFQLGNVEGKAIASKNSQSSESGRTWSEDEMRACLSWFWESGY